jgi:glucose/mannose transport system substrate-binding protein
MFRRLAFLSIALIPSVVGCNPPEPNNDDEVKLKFYTWWSVGGEKDALDALAAKNRERHPNVSLITYTLENAEKTFSELSALLTYGKQPDLFQANGGGRLFSHVVGMRVTPRVNSLGSTGEPPGNSDSRLKRLDDLYARSKTSIWKMLESAISINGVPYGVPLNVHRTNNLYYSIPKLKLFHRVSRVDDLKLPSNVDSFVGLAKDVKTFNGGKPSVGIGIRDTWTLEALVFENLMPSVAMMEKSWGAEGESLDERQRLRFFEDFWLGSRDPQSHLDHAIVDYTLERAQELFRYVQTYGEPGDDSPPGQWQDPFNDLFDEASGVSFVVMGDWATGYLERLGKQRHIDYGVMPFPGTEKLFIYATDTIPVTERAEHAAEAKDFLETALTAEAQIAFSLRKGSVPAIELSDDQVGQLEPHQKLAVRALRDPTVQKSMAMSGLVTPDLPPDLLRNSLLKMLKKSDAWEGRNVVHEFFKNHYWMLHDWTKRLKDDT